MVKKTIAIDFDGTIARYEAYQGKCVFGEPLSGAREAIEELKKDGWVVIIFTTRSESWAIREYLELHDIPFDFINHNPYNVEKDCFLGKPRADVYLDDRAVTFQGNWGKALYDVKNFSEWWRP